METITEIKDLEFENNDGFRTSWAGYEVVTNERRIRLYIENNQQCCENFGYFWSNDKMEDFLGSALYGIKLTDTSLNEVKFSERGINPRNLDYGGKVMFVNLITDRGVLQFVAYNDHNGYYGHEAAVECRELSCRILL